MFKKIFTIMFALLMIALLSANVSEAQTKKTTYPLFSIAPMVGVQFPAGGLNDIYKASWNAGLEMNLKVNKETSFFFKAGYFNMPARTDADVAGPDGSYIEITAGPRYVFTNPKLKARFFLEAGLGAYIHGSKDYTYNTYPVIGGPAVPKTIVSESKASFGVNVGPGVYIPLGGTVDLIVKTKLHYIFESGAARTFVTGIMGVDFNL
ncbi:MAG: hypothetical protein NTU73_01615 [Ignavibacteriae bacterium]|nr:hypothetical protein [Ignavibacteriota bacterium]